MTQPEEAAARRPSTPDELAKMGTISKEMDGAANYLAQTSSYPPMTPEVEKKLLRKIDWILVPMVGCVNEDQLATVLTSRPATVDGHPGCS